MTRVRGFTQDDAHLFCTRSRSPAEVSGCLELVKIVLGTLGMNDYRVRVGLRDPTSDKYVGDPEKLGPAEAAFREAAAKLGVPFTEEPGEAAFYGPKIDFVVKDVIGREWQLGTVQVDYNLPERFDLSYIGADNQPHRPVMIHRAPFGSLERFYRRAHRALRRPLSRSGSRPSRSASSPSPKRANRVRRESVTATLRRRRPARDPRCLSGQDRRQDPQRADSTKFRYMLVIGEKEAAARSVSVRHAKKGDLE